MSTYIARFALLPLDSEVDNDYYDYRDLPLGGQVMSTNIWTVAAAKAKFSEVIKRAQSDGPQTITRSGRTAVVIVAAEEWDRKTKRIGNLADFFASSPLRGSGLKARRVKHQPREVRACQ
jgi:prevent-host-death family protein